jgi:hypothetical protein
MSIWQPCFTYRIWNHMFYVKLCILYVHSVGQKSIALKFSKSRTGSDVRYSCHHNSSPHSRPFTVRNDPLYLLQLWCQFVSLTQQMPLCLSSPLMPTTSSNSPPLCYPSILTQIYSRILQLAAPKIALHVFLSLCTKTVSNYHVLSNNCKNI